MAREFPVSAVCQALGVSRSGYYGHRRKDERPRRVRDEQLKALIEEIFEESRRCYGSPRVHDALALKGVTCGENRVARLMREKELRAKSKRRRRPPQTTDSRHNHPVAPNLLAEIPKPDKPNQVWVSDITYVPTLEGWLYLACVMDLCSRRVVGWHMNTTLETSLVVRALERAIARRGAPPGLIHHSDRGSQYASGDYQALLALHRITPSMSRKGNCYDNAFMESFNATYKTEAIDRKHLAKRHETRLMTFDYIETFYNTTRLHSALERKSPAQFEAQFKAQPCPLTCAPAPGQALNQLEKRTRALQECNLPGISSRDGQPAMGPRERGSIIFSTVGVVHA